MDLFIDERTEEAIGKGDKQSVFSIGFICRYVFVGRCIIICMIIVVLYLIDKVLFFENIFKIVRFGKIRDKIIIDWL